MNIKAILWISVFILLISPLFMNFGAYGETQLIRITPDSPEFKSYWNAGKAEITSYKLEQARYGEIHSGYSVLVFVTEDFSKEKQVKLDRPGQGGDDKVRILKLNRIKKFDTGIYRYSMMDSVFTPLDINEYPNTLKLSSSSQEWCGNTFIQVNLRDGGFKVESFSYFESEGDTTFDLEDAFLEDELWTRIRIDPDSLPVGKIKIIPAAMASRLTHKELAVETAEASLGRNTDDPSSLMDYRIKYPASGRSVLITFKREFPYGIVSWEETYKSGFGENARELTTKATIDKTLITDYWNKNKPLDRVLREELGI
jgi:hypothetical protein